MQADRIDPAFGYWFAGFADGEACFWISHLQARRTFHIGMSIHLRADDLPLLECIQRTLEVGSLSVRERTDETTLSLGLGGAKPVAQYVVNSRADTRFLVDLFDRFPLRSKKARDFKVWREGVLAWDTLPVMRQPGKPGRPPRDWSHIIRLHDELKAVRKYA